MSDPLTKEAGEMLVFHGPGAVLIALRQRDALEAKLQRAVEALRECKGFTWKAGWGGTNGADQMLVVIDAALAEIEGDDHGKR